MKFRAVGIIAFALVVPMAFAGSSQAATAIDLGTAGSFASSAARG